MGIEGTLIVYGILGAVVAAALALHEERPSAARLAFLVVAAVPFWPLFAPSLLGRVVPRASQPRTDAPEDVGQRIGVAEEQILAALARVKGGVAGALVPEAARVKSLVGSLRALAGRLTEIDELLGAPEFDASRLTARVDEHLGRGLAADDARIVSLRARLRDVERLAGLRAQTTDELERALVKMEEITSQMLLLKFAGKPDAEVARLIDEIADGVEGMAEALHAVG